MLNLNNIKKSAVGHFKEESLKEAVNRHFANAIASINAGIDYLLDKLVIITFDDIKKVCIPKLFKLTNKKELGGRKSVGSRVCHSGRLR